MTPITDPRRDTGAQLVALFVITVLAAAAAGIAHGAVSALGWGQRPAWIIAGLCGALVWMLFVVLAAMMLSGQISRREEQAQPRFATPRLAVPEPPRAPELN